MEKRNPKNADDIPRNYGRGLDVWFTLAFLVACVAAISLSLVLRRAAANRAAEAKLRSAHESAITLSHLFEHKFSDFRRTLEAFMDSCDVSSLSPETKRRMEILYKLKRDDYVLDIAFVSPKMEIMHAVPDDRKIGADISKWPHNKTMVTAQKFDVSPPFKEGKNAPMALAVQMPVFKNNAFVGFLRFTVDFNALLENSENFARTKRDETIWIFDSKISVIKAPRGVMLKKIPLAEHMAIQRLVLKALKMGTGTLEAPLSDKGIDTSQNTKMAFNVASLAGGGEWVVCVVPQPYQPPSWMDIATSPTFLMPIAILLLFTAILATLRWRVQSKQTELFGRALETRRELLDEANARLAIILESMPYIVFESDPDGNITFFKPAPKKVLGYQVTDKTGMNLRDLAARDGREKIDKVFEDLLLNGASVHAMRVEMELVPNVVRTFSLNAIPSADAKGNIIKINGIMHDITTSVAMEESLEQSQKMDTIGAVASGVAHDFNNYLTTILGYAGLMKMKNIGGEELAHLEEAAKKAAELTEQLLTFSRPPKDSDDAITDLANHVPKTVEMVKKSFPKEIKVLLEIPKEPFHVKISSAKLDQILMNLLVNARDAIEDKGKVSVKLWKTHLSRILASRMGMLPGGYVVLEVSDSGKGFSETVRRRMFEPYFTTKKTGTGLGLAGAYMIVKNGGGNIISKSAPGKGATFYVYLPESEDTSETNDKKRVNTPEFMRAIQEDQEGCPKKILLVEDRDLIAKMVAKMLRDMGCEPILAADGTEGVRIFKRRGKDISVIVSDIVMEEMDGPEMLEEIRKMENGKFIPVLFISGKAPSDEMIDRIKKLNAAFLRKPFDLNKFLKKLKHLMGERNDAKNS